MKGVAQKYFRWRRPVIQQEVEPENEQHKSSGSTTELRMDLKLKQIDSDLSEAGGSLTDFAAALLSSLAKTMGISQGAFFIADKSKNKDILKYVAGYAYVLEETDDLAFEFGEGLTGQVAMDGKMMEIDTIPEGYLTIRSGLGQAAPASILLFPVMQKNKVVAVVELASFKKFLDYDKALIVSIMPTIAAKLQELKKTKNKL